MIVLDTDHFNILQIGKGPPYDAPQRRALAKIIGRQFNIGFLGGVLLVIALATAGCNRASDRPGVARPQAAKSSTPKPPAGAPEMSRAHVTAELDAERLEVLRQTSQLPHIDRVIVYALDSAVDDADPPTDGFAIRPYKDAFAAILDSKEVGGELAQEVAASWRELDFDEGSSALCHAPAYGLRFYDGEQLVFETSICWMCSNFFIRAEFRDDPQSADDEASDDEVVDKFEDTGYRWSGFRSNQPAAQGLLAKLQDIVPHSNFPTEDAVKERIRAQMEKNLQGD